MENNFNKFDPTRSYTSRRLDPWNDKVVVNEINNYFEKADEYLEVKDNIIVGKVLKGPKYDSNRKVIPYTFIGNKGLFENKVSHRKTTGNLAEILPKDFIRQPYRRRTTKKEGPIINIYDDIKIRQIFNDAKKRIDNNKTTPEISERFLLSRERFMKQEKLLDTLEDEKMRTTTFSKFMADKTKRTEENLLFNKTDAFRKKRNALELIENEKNLFDKFGNNYWLMDLRRPKSLNKLRTAYVNICPYINENRLTTLCDYADKAVEVILSPDSKDKRDINVSKFIKSKKLNASIKRIKNMSNLSIEGKSVLDEEIMRAKVTPGKKFIFKEPEKKAEEEVYKELYDDKIYLHEKTFGLK
jgi:hypothetical protein